MTHDHDIDWFCDDNLPCTEAPYSQVGCATTLSRMDNSPNLKRNPIGFIWPKDDDDAKLQIIR